MKKKIQNLLNKFPGLKNVFRVLRHYFWPVVGVSNSYVNLHDADADIEGKRLRTAWQNKDLPHRQRELVDQQLKKFNSGTYIDVFDVFINALRGLPDLAKNSSLLEIGCSSGYYSEVVATAGLDISYAGCDYSDAFIKLAKEKYPSISFAVMDATALHYADQSFDIVVSGCCLLHIPEYAKGIEETARVARRYAIFHRTPVVWGQNEQWFRKKAYDIETVEIHFKESAFLALLNLHGLEVISTYTLSEEIDIKFPSKGFAIRTYVCRKTDP